MPNYLDVISFAYPGIGASSNGDPTVYANIVWDSTVISQQNLDSAYSSLEDIVEQDNKTGFGKRANSNISYNKTTRTFTISAVRTSFEFYVQGYKYIKTTSNSVVWPNVEGVHFFYYDNTGTLTTGQLTSIPFGEVALVAYLYWDATSSDVIIFADERHGYEMGSATHSYLHNIQGAKYKNGLGASNYTLVGTGNNDIDAMISIADGEIADEDLTHSILHSSSPTLAMEQFLSGTISSLAGTPTSSIGAKIPVFYRSGATGIWRKRTAANAPVYKATNRLYYNQYTGATWQLTEATQDYYVCSFIYATNNMYEPIIAVLGQNQYDNLTDARVEFLEHQISFGEIPFKEIKCIARLIYQTASTYTNNFKAKLVDFIDLRTSMYIAGRTNQVTLASLGVSDGLMRDNDYATKLELNETRTRQASDQSASSGTVTLNYTNGDLFKVTASGSISIAVSNMPTGKVSSLTLQAINFGGYSITWPSGIKWAGGAAPSLTTTGTDFISIMKDGAGHTYGFLLGRDVK